MIDAVRFNLVADSQLLGLFMLMTCNTDDSILYSEVT